MLFFVMLVAGCGSPTEPEFTPPDWAEPIEPPARYAEYHAEMVECTGIDAPFSRIEWYSVPGSYRWRSTYNGESVPAEWWPPHAIYVSEPNVTDPTERTPGIIKHEIGHDLIQDADPDHSHPIWGECAPRGL